MVPILWLEDCFRPVVSAFCKVSGGAVHVKNIALQVDSDIIIGSGGKQADGVVCGDGVGGGLHFFGRGLVVVVVVALDMSIKELLKEGDDLVGDGWGRSGDDGHDDMMIVFVAVLYSKKSRLIICCLVVFSFFLILIFNF